MNKIALSMIVYNETDSLDRCLRSIQSYVDGIFIVQTSSNKETTKIAKAWGAKVKVMPDLHEVVTKEDVKWAKKYFGWTPDIKVGDKLFFFDKARNIALDMVTKDYKYVMWLDADDVFRNGAKIREVIEKMEEVNATSAYLNYLYEVELNEHNQVKNVLIEHLRERIVINNGTYKWVAPIHETLICQTGESRQIEAGSCDVLHLAEKSKRQDAIFRNLKVLEKSIINTKGKDPRPIYYLAKVFFDLHTDETFKKAEKLIFSYLQGDHKSGWAEERNQAWEYLAEIYKFTGQYNKAVKASLNGIAETNKFPTSYISLALTYMLQNKFEESLLWLKMAGVLPMPKTTLVVNPRDMVARSLEVLMNSHLRLNHLDEAWAAAFKLREIVPPSEKLDKFCEMLTQLREERDLTKNYIAVAKKLISTNSKEKLAALIKATPALIEQNPIIGEFIKTHSPPRDWSNDEIAIYCGPGWTIWNPELLKNPKGAFIGGSEEAVIYAASELSNAGYKVTIYAEPGEEGVYEGVTYKNFFKFNKDDSFNILIGWRMPSFFDIKYKAKKTYLWLHDVANQIDYTKERLDNVTKIFVLSRAHRECLPAIPDEKFLITSNGFKEIYPEIRPDNIKTQCIWTSSYDRGLQHLLEMWPDVKRKVPSATLKIFYGWDLFDRFYHNNPERMEWKKKMENMMRYDGITESGRIPQHELEKEIKKSGIWTYPTDFYEINCISAIKAQAFGAVPVVINYAALRETVQHGVKIEGDIWDKEVKKLYTKELINALKSNFDRKAMMKWAKSKYSWKSVINSWVNEFKHGAI